MGMAGESSEFGLGDLVFEGVQEDGSGNYTVATVTEDEFTFSQDEISISFKAITIENLFVPADSTLDTMDNMFFYDRATTSPPIVTVEGNDVLGIARSDTRNTKSSDGNRWDFDARVDGLEIDLSSVPDAEARQVIDGMGYQNLNGDLVIK